MDCPFCNSARLRNSRTRVADIPHLLVLQSPVRCHNCQERLYVPIWQAREIRRASKLRREEERLRRSAQN
jgi:C4-type Zn-finger protein